MGAPYDYRFTYSNGHGLHPSKFHLEGQRRPVAPAAIAAMRHTVYSNGEDSLQQAGLSCGLASRPDVIGLRLGVTKGAP